MKVENMVSQKGNDIANQFIIRSTEGKTFQSYNSTICIYTGDKLKLFSDWDYSRTTLKYFKEFINDETCFTYEDKAQWEKEIKNNENIEVL